MSDDLNELPWNSAPTSTACNFALGHLVGNLPRGLTVDGQIHAETYISAVGAIAGFAAGMPRHRLPDLTSMFEHVSATLGGAAEGTSSVSPDHQAHMPARDLLKIVWPVARMCFSGKLHSAGREHGAAPIEWWSAIAARAATRPVHDIKDALSPEIALTLLMESAIYCSKLDRTRVEGA